MLRPQFNANSFKRFFKDFNKRVNDAIIDRLCFIGEAAVSDAKTLSTFQDDTRNLRGSMSYVVLFNGQIKSPGRIPRQSRQVIAELMLEFGSGYVLILVAGMHYAAAVESKGYDVISNSAVIATAKLYTMMGDLQNNLGR